MDTVNIGIDVDIKLKIVMQSGFFIDYILYMRV